MRERREGERDRQTDRQTVTEGDREGLRQTHRDTETENGPWRQRNQDPFGVLGDAWSWGQASLWLSPPLCWWMGGKSVLCILVRMLRGQVRFPSTAPGGQGPELQLRPPPALLPSTSFRRKCCSLIRIIYKIMVHCLH